MASPSPTAPCNPSRRRPRHDRDARPGRRRAERVRSRADPHSSIDPAARLHAGAGSAIPDHPPGGGRDRGVDGPQGLDRSHRRRRVGRCRRPGRTRHGRASGGRLRLSLARDQSSGIRRRGASCAGNDLRHDQRSDDHRGRAELTAGPPRRRSDRQPRRRRRRAGTGGDDPDGVRAGGGRLPSPDRFRPGDDLSLPGRRGGSGRGRKPRRWVRLLPEPPFPRHRHPAAGARPLSAQPRAGHSRQPLYAPASAPHRAWRGAAGHERQRPALRVPDPPAVSAQHGRSGLGVRVDHRR
jgi:hypothetical protein